MDKNIIPDSWLANILQRKVYKLELDDSFAKKMRDEKSNEYSHLLQTLQTKPVFIYAKVSPVPLTNARFLDKLGFSLVDTNIVFEKPVSLSHKMAGNCDVRLAIPDDKAQTIELAKRSFVYSRFHLDDTFSSEIANTIKAEWTRNYFTGKRGDTMVVALVDKTIVGFLQLLKASDFAFIIDLIAVDSNYRKQGIASDMIIYAEMHCRQVKKVRVGTQIANIPSIRLYEKLGFRFSEASYVFHYHNV